MRTTALALDHLLCATGNPLADLRDIAQDHPEFGRAQMIRIGAGILAKDPARHAAIARAIASLRGFELTERTRLHIEAAQAWIEGRPVSAAQAYRAIVARSPHDLLALRLAQSACFYLGWRQPLREIVDAALPAWAPDQYGYVFVLSLAAFAHAETGDAGRAEELGRRALAIEPSCPMGVHAVTHALIESGRASEGAAWMRNQIAHWAAESRMRTHNAWHLGLFDAQAGNVTSALGILDGWLLPASRDSAVEACDAAALLWRLWAGGVEDKGRWQRISGDFLRTHRPGFWPLVDLHALVAHLCAGQLGHARELEAAIGRCAGGTDHAAQRARRVTLPALQTLRAWIEGRAADAVALFHRVQPVLGEAGGSGAQLEIFHDIACLAHSATGRAQAREVPLPAPERTDRRSALPALEIP